MGWKIGNETGGRGLKLVRCGIRNRENFINLFYEKNTRVTEMKQLKGKGLEMEKMGNMSILKAFFLKKPSLSRQIFLAKHLNPWFYVLMHEAPFFNRYFKRKFKLIFFHFYFRHVSGNGGR